STPRARGIPSWPRRSRASAGSGATPTRTWSSTRSRMPALPWREVLFAAYLVWLIAAAATLLVRRRSPASTLAWIFAFAAVPVLSGLYYWVFGPHRMHRRSRRYDRIRGALAGEVSAYLHASSGAGTSLPPHVRGLAAV